MAIYLSSTAAKRFTRDYCLNRLTAVSGSLKGKKVLDVGCGFGEKASMMKKQNASVLGIDISPAAVSFCNDKLGIETQCTSIENLPIGGNPFDIVTMFEFIEHPMEPLTALRAAADIMKKGALLVIVTPNGTAGERWWHNREREWIGFRVDLEHFQYLHVDTIDYLCHKLNFRQVHLEQFGHRAQDYMIQPRQQKVKSESSKYVKKYLKNIPGMRQTVYAFHEYRAKLHEILQPPEAGDYHLFTILQKK